MQTGAGDRSKFLRNLGTAAIEFQLERETGIEPATFSLGS